MELLKEAARDIGGRIILAVAGVAMIYIIIRFIAMPLVPHMMPVILPIPHHHP